MVPGISLANKCQLLFSLAVLLILTAALIVPWVTWAGSVRETQFDAARQLASAMMSAEVVPGDWETFPRIPQPGSLDDGLRLTIVPAPEVRLDDQRDPFIADAMVVIRDGEADEYADTGREDDELVYRYARVIRFADLKNLPAAWRDAFDPDLEPDETAGLLVIDRTSRFAAGQLLMGRVYVVAAGIIAGLLAVAVFYLILTKIVLSPVRRLRETTEKVEQGDLTIRSNLQTGDEFQQLSETFNAMLDRIGRTQDQLRTINETLDLKVDELSEANIGLYESNRLKGEFLANVSHELRTPLNSIIGFAELLEELANEDEQADARRGRYLRNITNSGRELLEMINQLLDMAKIEAGRMDVSIAPVSIPDIIEGLMNVMRPQAEAKSIELVRELATNVPLVETDAGKLQQILYNFLSNAIKFTPEGGTVRVTANREMRQDRRFGVRLAVADTGPGIPADMEDLIFEKFRQVDSGHTRQFAGTGLGLAICRDLAELLGASVSFSSTPDQGATFFVDLPQAYQPNEPQPLMG